MCLKYCPMAYIITYVPIIILAKDRNQGLTRAMGLQAFHYLLSGNVEYWSCISLLVVIEL